MLFPVVALAVLCLYSDGSVETKEPGPIGRPPRSGFALGNLSFTFEISACGMQAHVRKSWTFGHRSRGRASKNAITPRNARTQNDRQ